MPTTRAGSEARRSTTPRIAAPKRKAPKKSKRRPRACTSSSSSAPKLSQYVRDLQALPTTKSGIDLQAKFVNERVAKIKKDRALSGDLPAEESLTELLQKVNEIHGFGPHGKVGMHIRQETLETLQEALAAMDDVPEEDAPSESSPEDDLDDAADAATMDDDLSAENIQETFEGLDRDLLGVNSQSALDKISAFVTKTIVDNHPSKSQPPVSATQLSTQLTTSLPVIPSSIASTSSSSSSKQPPFKFAFLSVVATYDAKCPVSLQDLHAKIRTITFDPTWFHSAVLTFPKSECRAAIFENGKFVLTGVTTIKTALIAARNVLEIFKLCGYHPDISKRNFRAKNLTALMELGVNIDIAGFAEKHQHNTYMDQDTFGAVTHFPEKSPSTIHKGGLGLCLLIFATGKIVLVGGKTEKHMISVFRDKTLHLLKPFAFGWS